MKDRRRKAEWEMRQNNVEQIEKRMGKGRGRRNDKREGNRTGEGRERLDRNRVWNGG